MKNQMEQLNHEPHAGSIYGLRGIAVYLEGLIGDVVSRFINVSTGSAMWLVYLLSSPDPKP